MKLFSLKELANWIGLDRNTLFGHVQKKRLKTIKVGSVHRVTPEQVSEYLSGQFSPQEVLAALEELRKEEEKVGA